MRVAQYIFCTWYRGEKMPGKVRHLLSYLGVFLGTYATLRVGTTDLNRSFDDRPVTNARSLLPRFLPCFFFGMTPLFWPLKFCRENYKKLIGFFLLFTFRPQSSFKKSESFLDSF